MEFLSINNASSTLQSVADKLIELYEIHDWYFCPIKSEKQASSTKECKSSWKPLFINLSFSPHALWTFKNF